MVVVMAVVLTSSCISWSSNYSSDINYPLAPEEIRSIPLKTLDGEEFRISERSGKVLLLNFWATWCIPCIEEMPDLVSLQKELGNEKFQILGMNTEILTHEEDNQSFEELDRKVRAMVKEQGLNYEIVWTSTEAYEAAAKIAKFPGIPLSLIINTEGKVVGAFRGAGPSTVEKMKKVARETVAAIESGV